MSFLGTVGSSTMFLAGLASGAVLELDGAVVAGLAVGGGALGWSSLHMLGLGSVSAPVLYLQVL